MKQGLKLKLVVICVILAVIAAAVILILTYGGKGKTEEVPQTTSEKIVLSFGINDAGLPESGITQQLALDFENETGVKIEFEVIAGSQWRDLLKTRLASGIAPDIFAADTDPFSIYENIRPDVNCIDLTDEEFVSRMDATTIPSISYNDRVYGITFPGKKIWVYTYNKEIFSSLDIDVPTTYAQLKEAARKILASGVTPMWEATQTSWHQVLPLFETGLMYEQKNPGVYDELNANETNIVELPELLEIVKQMKEFAELGYFGDNYMENVREDNAAAFANGEVAMVLEEIGWSMEVNELYPEMADKTGIFVMPWGDNQTVGVNPASVAFFGNAASEHKDEILGYFRFLARHENLQKRIDGDPSTLMICWPEIESKYPKEYTDYLGTLESGVVMQVGVSYIGSQWMDIGKDIEAMFAGNMTAEEVVMNISVRRDQYAAIAKDKNWAE